MFACTAAPAYAQFGGAAACRGMGGSPAGAAFGGPAPGEQKPEGPAEQAPEEKVEGQALQPLPAWPQEKEKKLQFFQLNGYIRFRSYLFHNFNLGVNPIPGGPAAPFHVPYSEIGSTGMAGNAANQASNCATRDNSNCRTTNMTSADMRLRLEPTLNVTEQVRVKAQIDVFDNLVLGSTPEGYYLNGATAGGNVPTSVYSNTQVPPTSGSNSVLASINAKRAWAEVQTPFGELKFGRMPTHWGTGMVINDGNCLDCNYGQTSDRVMFSTKLWGHFIAFMWDWVATGPTTAIIGPSLQQGQPFNADTLDDVSQWVLTLGRLDSAEEIKERVDQGKIVFNYGLYAAYRQQDWSESVNPSSATGNTTTLPGDNLQRTLVPRHAKTGLVDVYLRLDWKKLHLEAEGVVHVGTIGNLTDVYSTVHGSTSLLSGAFVVKGNYKLLHDQLHLNLEIGYASGDDSEDPNAVLNYQTATLAPVNNRIGRFTMDPDYIVDMILFRYILGAVSNATYFKPGASYDIIDNFGARVDLIYSVANNFVANPAKAHNLGRVCYAPDTYKNEEEGFYASLAYGVLFPFGALDLPGSIYPCCGHGSTAAQTLQARLAVKF